MAGKTTHNHNNHTKPNGRTLENEDVMSCYSCSKTAGSSHNQANEDKQEFGWMTLLPMLSVHSSIRSHLIRGCALHQGSHAKPQLLLRFKSTQAKQDGEKRHIVARKYASSSSPFFTAVLAHGYPSNLRVLKKTLFAVSQGVKPTHELFYAERYYTYHNPYVPSYVQTLRIFLRASTAPTITHSVAREADFKKKTLYGLFWTAAIAATGVGYAYYTTMAGHSIRLTCTRIVPTDSSGLKLLSFSLAVGVTAITPMILRLWYGRCVSK